MGVREDELYMEEALKWAKKAALLGEVPVGAVIVRDNEIISAACNRREVDRAATAHAELLAIEEACQSLAAGGYKTAPFMLLWSLVQCAPAPLSMRESSESFTVPKTTRQEPADPLQIFSKWTLTIVRF